ncbi:MAG: hypothetical protein HYV27_19580 [Candidatus Hydrogenedentes bacterium]|nr:hypothetical protein [Candidatus Hydrogenedentota bacterium]
MLTQITQRILDRHLLEARLCLLVEVGVRQAVIWAPWTLVAGSAAVVLDQYLAQGGHAWSIGVAAAAMVLLAVIAGALRAALRPGAAVAFLDDRAGLQDHVASALVFAGRGAGSAPEQAQLRDTVRRIYNIDTVSLIRWPAPHRFALAGLLLAVFMTCVRQGPAWFSPAPAPDAVAAEDLGSREQLEDLVKNLEQREREGLLPVEGMDDALEALRAQLAADEPDPAEAMRALNELERALSESAEKAGTVEALEKDLSKLEEAMSASAASQGVAQALSEEDLEAARERLQELSERTQDGEVSEPDRQVLAQALQRGAEALRQQQSSSGLSEDMEAAASGMSQNNAQQFKQSAQSMQDKLKQVETSRSIREARQEVRMERMAMSEGQQPSEGKEPGSGTPGDGEAPDDQSGQPRAGNQTDSNLLGEQEQLSNEYQKILQAQGAVGAGERQSMTLESGAGRTQGQTASQELHANYAAAAEAAIAREAIPLSRKLHVKRYFQVIRPE